MGSAIGPSGDDVRHRAALGWLRAVPDARRSAVHITISPSAAHLTR